LTPIVIRKSDTLKHWKFLKWSIEEWKVKCNKIKFLFRLHPRETNSDSIDWENEAIDKFDATLEQYFDWKQNTMKDDNPFKPYPPQHFWAYTGYNHLSKLSGSEELITSINWSKLGFGSNLGNDGKETTFWLGCKDATTPCHYDSYGYNLVAQIKGK